MKAARTNEDLHVVQAKISGMLIIGDGRSPSPKLYPKGNAKRMANRLNKVRTETDIKVHGVWEALPVKLTILPNPENLRPQFVKD